jgi:post-segregation antitoxin (ccd killing protein)
VRADHGTLIVIDASVVVIALADGGLAAAGDLDERRSDFGDVARSDRRRGRAPGGCSVGRCLPGGVCRVRRMPRMQVYLPDDLYAAVKERKLPASELLQEAVQAELRRQRLNEQADAYLAELVAEVGEPSPRERARADAIARRIRDRAVVRQAG